MLQAAIRCLRLTQIVHCPRLHFGSKPLQISTQAGRVYTRSRQYNYIMDAPQARVTLPEAAQRSPKRRKIDAASNDSAPETDPQKPASQPVTADAAAAAVAIPGNNKAGAQQQQRRGKKNVLDDPVKALIRKCSVGIAQCAKAQDMATALSLLEEAEQEGVALQNHTYNTLLYLAVGGNNWEELARGGHPDTCAVLKAQGCSDPAAAAAAGAPAVPAANPEGSAAPAPAEAAGPSVSAELDRHVAAAGRVWDVMQARGVQPDSGTYLALARMEGLRHDPEAALEWVHKTKAARQQLQLRLFHPALLGYCLARKAERALAVDALITEQQMENLDLTEYEYARLVEALAADPEARWSDMKSVLGRMTKELNELSNPTLDLLRAFFTCSKAGARALAEDAGGEGEGGARTRWSVEDVEVSSDGTCAAAGGKLVRVDLEEKEWESFAKGVASLAQKSEKGKTDFSSYMTWLENNGPFDLLIDAANVAYSGQNRAGGGFSWNQVKRMVTAARHAHPGAKLLVMVHRRRVMDPEACRPEARQFINELKMQNALFATPIGSNDDWYWMYAAVHARAGGMLISNDELRDHIFTLMRPKYFLKWKAVHITQYFFPGANSNPILLPPAPFTACVQRLDSGAWMFPSQTKGRWVCAKPV